jgi:RNA polymerase sigma-70 factor (ECF subfamily)
MEPTDFELLSRYRAGEVEALEILVERHRQPLFGYILRMTRNRTEAEDVFQDVWLRAIGGLDRYRERHFMGWLVRIAHNRVVDRSRRKRPELCLDSAADGATPLVERLVSPAPGPDDRLAAAERAAVIAAAVRNLPAEQREVFLLRMQTETPFREIARLQRVSINTALARMQYALAKLRKALADEAGWEDAQ